MYVIPLHVKMETFCVFGRDDTNEMSIILLHVFSGWWMMIIVDGVMCCRGILGGGFEGEGKG